MSKSKAKELAGYSFLVVFANDDSIDAAELAMLERLALEDGVVDDEEREVLKRIFERAEPDHLVRQVSSEIERFRERYDI